MDRQLTGVFMDRQLTGVFTKVEETKSQCLQKYGLTKLVTFFLGWQ